MYCDLIKFQDINFKSINTLNLRINVKNFRSYPKKSEIRAENNSQKRLPPYLLPQCSGDTLKYVRYDITLI